MMQVLEIMMQVLEIMAKTPTKETPRRAISGPNLWI
jgi:hypothetical protein